MRNIKHTLVVSNSLIVSVALLILTGVLVFVQTKDLNRTINQNAINVCEQVNTTLDAFFITPEKIVEHSVKYVKSQENASRKQIEDFFGSLTEANANNELLYYTELKSVKDGGLFYSDAHWIPPASYDQTTTVWYKNSTASLFTKISEPFISPVTGKRTVAVSRVITRQGEKLGIVAMNINLEKVQNIVAAATLSKSGQSFLINKAGLYVTNPEAGKIMNANFYDDFGLENMSKQIKNEPLIITKVNGDKYFVARKVVTDGDWYFVSIGNRGDLYKEINTNIGFTLVIIVICLILSIFVGVVIANRLVKPIKGVGDSIQNISSGDADLTNRIKTNRTDAIGVLIREFNGFIEKLQNIMNQIKNSKDGLSDVKDKLASSVKETSEAIQKISQEIAQVGSQISVQGDSVQQTSAAVSQIAQSIDNMEKLVEAQSSGVVEASAAVEEMIGNINSVNASVEKMASSFRDLQGTAVSGVENQRAVMEKIALIEEQSKSLMDANKAIASVASQTNLLAMNAAIEAAHAGEAGRGFAVVADEIRKLSESSTAQSKHIGSELKNIQNTISVVAAASRVSSQNFDDVSSKIQATDQIVNQIKNAMEEQNEGSKQIAEALHSMNESTAEVRSASKEMLSGNQQILGEITNLQNVTSNIQESVSSMTSGAGKIEQMGVSLSEISQKVDTSITEIGQQIDQFRT